MYNNDYETPCFYEEDENSQENFQCCECARGPRGFRGPQGCPGEPGEPGNTGATGATGPTPTAVHGSFFSFNAGPFTAPNTLGTSTSIIPTETASPAPETTAGAFTANANGTVTVNNAGCYLITATVNVAAGSSGVFGIVVNSGGIATPYIESFGNQTPNTQGSTQLNRSSIICVQAGDTINIGLAQAETNPVQLINPSVVAAGGLLSTPASSLTFTQLN